MSRFKFAIFYLHSKVVKVESTSIIVNNSNPFLQIASQPDLEDDNWIEIKCGSRKEPSKTEAAMVLLFGDSFQQLLIKKNLFLLGKDIWTDGVPGTENETHGKAKATQENKKPPTIKKGKLTASARNEVLSQLKETLSQKRALAHSEELFSSSSEGNYSPVRMTKKKRAPQHFSPEPSSSDDTDIGGTHAANNDKSLEKLAEVLREQHSELRKNAVAPTIGEIVECLRDLPETIKQLKECMENLKSLSQSQSPSVSSVSQSLLSSDTEVEMHVLPGNTVAVSKRAFQRLNRSRMTIFAQELAVLVFSKDILAQSTLTGKSAKGGLPKTQLDTSKVQAVVDAVIEQFPQATLFEVRAAIRRKCNNEQFSHKKANATVI